ncbi:AAA family ATPase [Arthrospira platensis]|uniref:AAA family ATPase n=1 Tax=Limnospira platensis TaxID=118562 RepID=UPI0007A0E8CA|nr:MoxR family ATPase [Arthrospira platensis]AMW27648.1 ATPase [Arthrospira platensis YZ]MBD2670995.1 MoxR family ATPase [Arthrospira platensis FACHB-439]MBD2711929.1 MoxR family ATPase [Arthrospira platensis FACHB-835]QQW30407.1 MoxR family ATPase [Arthrospira sp. PCC 9108]MBD2574853.1 MoxR family ATPase [Arthrospira platensis FACHB-971]
MDEILTTPPDNLRYTGKKHPPTDHKENGQRVYPYLPSDELVEAVNLAIILQRPLLLQGEPGCGKTKLAQAVAYELGLPYLCWTIKSTSRAQDGLYTYNNLARLRDSQLLGLGQITDPEEIRRIKDPKTYVELGKLGEAFLSDKTTVLLIDEIDKADIDFPNDLLLELDEKRFTIPETKKEKTAKHPPIILITSNQERDLPDAFLRRCLFHYIQFPNKERLIEIIIARFFGVTEDKSTIPEPENQLIEAAVAKFSELRELLDKEKGQRGKNISTSELIDWFDVLRRYPHDEVLKQLQGKLPYLGVLLKSWDDHRLYLSKL